MITDEYDSSKSYAVGDYCIKDNTLYKCTTAISTAEAFNSAHWSATTIDEELKLKQDNLTAGTGINLANNALSVKYGTATGTACQGNDSRLSNSRTPTSHASSKTTYGVGTTSNYGHCKTRNNLTASSHTDGEALSAYQGYLLDQKITNNFFYKSGDSYSDSGLFHAGGMITGGLSEIQTTITLPKRLDNISNISVNSYKLTTRKIEGGYLLNQATSGLTVIASKVDDCHIRLSIKNSDGSTFDSTNNTPVCVSIYSLSLSFS